MPFDFSKQMKGFMPVPAPTTKATDLSPHVDGGYSGTDGPATVTSDDQQSTMWLAAAIVLVALALLWILGAIVFRKVSL